ncbi:MAG: ATP-binding cassette domain-containing protein, partial [Firmicutes bacterium]|nr:ATP-binding cassette domain-containing protein [Bacillota bacterium]
MLSVKNLTKTYKTKDGVLVRALDDVTLDFPDTGMVFLLGKSGSGKSTLLNVAGGLDVPDAGEIIVKGKSSKTFAGSDFDSYRNTYVGFVFQEYNVINEFSVAENIALALQLQGKKNDGVAVEEILKRVELDGLGKRKPLTLSGGQKQRVAIARALVKEPEIIMADEPTGALDSATGKQVFDTLKRLSADKLVVVVSHDREFAETYGDRIIELSDGRVISDVSKNFAEAEKLSENLRAIDAQTVSIQNPELLTRSEFEKVWEMIKSGGTAPADCGKPVGDAVLGVPHRTEPVGREPSSTAVHPSEPVGADGNPPERPAGKPSASREIIITSDAQKVSRFKQSNRIAESGAQEYFADTKSTDIKQKAYDGNQTKFIKSRLPIRHAVKVGASSLKARPIRLVLTIIISVLSFTLFGAASTMMMYDVNFTAERSLTGTSYSTALMQKSYQVREYSRDVYMDNDKKIHERKYKNAYNVFDFSAAGELEKLNRKSLGVQFAGVFSLYGEQDLVQYQIANYYEAYGNYAPFYGINWLCGFSDAGERYLKDAFGANVCLAGRYPVADDEIAISEYVFETFRAKGLAVAGGEGVPDAKAEIAVPADIVGKTVSIRDNMSNPVSFKVSGVYRTGSVDKKFDPMKSDAFNSTTPANRKLTEEFNEVYQYSFHTLAFVSGTFYQNVVTPKIGSGEWYRYGYHPVTGGDYRLQSANAAFSQLGDVSPEAGYYGGLSYITPEWADPFLDGAAVYDFNGNKLPTSVVKDLKKNEMYLSASDLYSRARVLLGSMLLVEGKPEVPDDGDYYQYYFQANPEFSAALLRLGYFINGYWEGDPESMPAKREFTGADAKIIFAALKNDWDAWLKNNPDGLKGMGSFGDADKYYFGAGKYLQLAGVFASQELRYQTLVHGDFVTENADYYNYRFTKAETRYTPVTNGKYCYVVSPLATKSAQLKYLLAFNKPASDDSLFEFAHNQVYYQSRDAGYMVSMLMWAFIAIGAGLAVISALFLLNYISLSIVDKSREIGILRAVGARGADVFKIFFSESAIIAGICTVISVIAAIIVCAVANSVMAGSVFAIEILNFRILNGLFVLGIAAAVAFAATIFPVLRAAKKPPVEAIRSL